MKTSAKDIYLDRSKMRKSLATGRNDLPDIFGGELTISEMIKGTASLNSSWRRVRMHIRVETEYETKDLYFMNLWDWEENSAIARWLFDSEPQPAPHHLEVRKTLALKAMERGIQFIEKYVSILERVAGSLEDHPEAEIEFYANKDLVRRLLQCGLTAHWLLSKMDASRPSKETPERPSYPVEISGPPLSETVIENRR